MEISIREDGKHLVIRGIDLDLNVEKATITIVRNQPKEYKTMLSVDNGELELRVHRKQNNLDKIYSVLVTLDFEDGNNASFDLEDPKAISDEWATLKQQGNQSSTGGIHCDPQRGCPPAG